MYFRGCLRQYSRVITDSTSGLKISGGTGIVTIVEDSEEKEKALKCGLARPSLQERELDYILDDSVGAGGA